MFIFLPQIIRFTKIAPSEHLDGFIVEFPSTKFGDSLGNLSRTMKRFLNYLDKFDPKQSGSLARNLESKKWQFNFNGLDLFFIAFAPFYPESNARNSKSDKTYIFLQPQVMFKNKIARNKIKDTKELIRDKFDEKGQSYRGPLMDEDLESYKFVKPLYVHDPPIKWWEA
jgi:FPC/CPF motif-containing protein YcgG